MIAQTTSVVIKTGHHWCAIEALDYEQVSHISRIGRLWDHNTINVCVRIRIAFVVVVELCLLIFLRILFANHIKCSLLVRARHIYSDHLVANKTEHIARRQPACDCYICCGFMLRSYAHPSAKEYSHLIHLSLCLSNHHVNYMCIRNALFLYSAIFFFVIYGCFVYRCIAAVVCRTTLMVRKLHLLWWTCGEHNRRLNDGHIKR